MSEFIMEINDLTHFNNEGEIYNITLGLKHKEVHAIIIKNSGEQVAFIESIISNKLNTLKIKKAEDNQKIGEEDIVIIYKEPFLINNLSIAENLFFEKLPRKKLFPFLIDWGKIKEDSNKIKSLIDSDTNFKLKVKELSTENKKMLYLYKCFNKNPKIIIMQEPMEYLSSDNIVKANKLIKNYLNNGGSIIYITKQWEEALSFSNWITVISKGKINGRMSAEEAKSNPRKLLSYVEGYHYKDSQDKEGNNVINAVFKSAEYLTSEYELNEILTLLAKELTEVMGVEGCSIDLINSPTNTIIEEYSYTRSLVELPPLKEKFILEIASQKDIFYANANDTEFRSMFDGMVDIKTIISIPILIRTQLSGVIHIYYKDIYTQSQEETMYLLTFARHAAIAIEDTRLLGRSALLQESHHRIKNNLQSIITLITMQREYLEGDNRKAINEVFDKIVSSIMSIASIHELLSKNEHGSIINLSEILDVLITTFGLEGIIVKKEFDNVFISYSKATSIAIIVNELLTNIRRHAFKGLAEDYKKAISISLKMIDDDMILIVKDNGVGLPTDFDVDNINSIGISILCGIIKNEFNGNISFENMDGTMIKIVVSRRWII